jgi:hypothetical protein
LFEPPPIAARQRLGLVHDPDQRAKRADHGEDAGDIALVEGMHRHALADQGRHDVGLKIGEGEYQIGLQRQNLRHVGRDEGRHPRLLPAHL